MFSVNLGNSGSSRSRYTNVPPPQPWIKKDVGFFSRMFYTSPIDQQNFIKAKYGELWYESDVRAAVFYDTILMGIIVTLIIALIVGWVAGSGYSIEEKDSNDVNCYYSQGKRTCNTHNIVHGESKGFQFRWFFGALVVGGVLTGISYLYQNYKINYDWKGFKYDVINEIHAKYAEDQQLKSNVAEASAVSSLYQQSSGNVQEFQKLVESDLPRPDSQLRGVYSRYANRRMQNES